MLTEELLVKHIMVLIMTVFKCSIAGIKFLYETSHSSHVAISNVYLPIWALSKSLIFLYGFQFLPSVASTAMATSLFTCVMANSRIIVERSPFGSRSFLTGLKNNIATFLSSALPHIKSFYMLKIMHYILQNLYGNNFHNLDVYHEKLM